MKIDILSLLVGGLLWELVSTYIHVFKMIYKHEKKKKDKINSTNKTESYSEPSIGFECKLKNEES